jgi:hypothetical protein
VPFPCFLKSNFGCEVPCRQTTQIGHCINWRYPPVCPTGRPRWPRPAPPPRPSQRMAPGAAHWSRGTTCPPPWDGQDARDTKVYHRMCSRGWLCTQKLNGFFVVQAPKACVVHNTRYKRMVLLVVARCYYRCHIYLWEGTCLSAWRMIEFRVNALCYLCEGGTTTRSASRHRTGRVMDKTLDVR